MRPSGCFSREGSVLCLWGMRMVGEDGEVAEVSWVVHAMAGEVLAGADAAASLQDLVLEVAAASGDRRLPLRLAARLIGSRDVPMSDLAFLLWSLWSSGAVDPADLEGLGMSMEAVGALGGMIAGAGSAAGLAYELDVRTCLSSLESELDGLMVSEGFGSSSRSALGLVLVEFALSEGLSSLGEAFSRLREEDPGRLPPSSAGDAS